jgi:hypothetical protein
MSDQETIGLLSKEIETLRREIQSQKSNLRQLGIVVMILVTIVYLMLLPVGISILPGTLISLILGIILFIIPLFIITGFLIVNDFKN